jgi:hypothetical protein
VCRRLEFRKFLSIDVPVGRPLASRSDSAVIRVIDAGALHYCLFMVSRPWVASWREIIEMPRISSAIREVGQRRIVEDGE